MFRERFNARDKLWIGNTIYLISNTQPVQIDISHRPESNYFNVGTFDRCPLADRRDDERFLYFPTPWRYHTCGGIAYYHRYLLSLYRSRWHWRLFPTRAFFVGGRASCNSRVRVLTSVIRRRSISRTININSRVFVLCARWNNFSNQHNGHRA